MSMLSNIAKSLPALGGIVAEVSPSAVISPATATRPYIMGCAVTGIIPAANRETSKVVIGQAAEIKGAMVLGLPQLEQRGSFVEAGFDGKYNNVGLTGAFWCALDLAHFTASDVEALSAEGVLSVDKNGVFSYGTANVIGNDAAGTSADNIQVTNAKVLQYVATPIIGAIDSQVVSGSETYTFKYSSGIGAILLVLK